MGLIIVIYISIQFCVFTYPNIVIPSTGQNRTVRLTNYL